MLDVKLCRECVYQRQRGAAQDHMTYCELEPSVNLRIARAECGGSRWAAKAGVIIAQAPVPREIEPALLSPAMRERAARTSDTEARILLLLGADRIDRLQREIDDLHDRLEVPECDR